MFLTTEALGSEEEMNKKEDTVDSGCFSTIHKKSLYDWYMLGFLYPTTFDRVDEQPKTDEARASLAVGIHHRESKECPWVPRDVSSLISFIKG